MSMPRKHQRNAARDVNGRGHARAWWPQVFCVSVLLLAAAGARASEPAGGSFEEQVNLLRLGQIAVHHDGRIKSFDSFASSMMHYVSGPRDIDGHSATFLYLDLMLRPGAYEGRDIIYVKKKLVRHHIADALRGSAAAAEPGFDERIARFLDEGLISVRWLMVEEVQRLRATLEQDLIRTARDMNMIRTALSLTEPRALFDAWSIVPPAEGDLYTPWLSLGEAIGIGGPPAADLRGLDEATQAQLLAAWRGVVEGWAAQDATAVNAATGDLAATLAAINPDVYPARNRLAWESWYFHKHNLTWVWVVYALALVPLLASVAFRWSAARWMGLAIFVLAFGFQTFALGLRWYVADRWPNSNMFEAVTTSTWFGACGAIVLELLVRRTPMRGLFALGSAVACMVAFMCAHFQPMYLNPNIENRMPVLHDVWLYIHTNVIIFSYCLIFMAAATAGLYLAYRVLGGLLGFGSRDDFARVGGAGSLIMTTPEGSTYIARARTSLGQVLDGVTMVLMELAFIMLWAGIVMGAIWADHSWGRPWGWDPKEVFALNTFIVFAILVHVRLKTRDKGLWTAIIALIGAGVMLFNWIAINFVITGLHSYA